MDNYNKNSAKRFQKDVFKIEKLKYYLLKHQLSFLIPKVEQGMSNKKDRLIKKAKTPDEISKIERMYKRELILFRKELQYEENRNYHFGIDYNKEFKEYLKWNKDVHIKCLIKNAIEIAASILGMIIFSGVFDIIALTILIGNALGSIINMECINLQNYHIARYDKIENKLKEKQATKINQIQDKYPNAINSINMQIEQSKSLPKINVNEMKIEALMELRTMLNEVSSQNIRRGR